MRNQGYQKNIIWVLIVAFLNLLLIISPGGMIMANQKENLSMSANQSIDQMKHTACHTVTTPQSDPDLTDTINCPDKLCEEDCSYCVQIGSGIPTNLALLLTPEIESFVASDHFNLVGPGYELIPPPPKTLSC